MHLYRVPYHGWNLDSVVLFYLIILKNTLICVHVDKSFIIFAPY